MNQLQAFRGQLEALRRQRRKLRWVTAYAALASAILLTLLTLFALDVAFELSVNQRAAMIVLAIVVLVWAFRRFTLPFLGIHENETSLAIQVEKQYGIDSDLVAALQFERAEAAQWGSRALESAVIERVAKLTPQLDVFQGLDFTGRNRRLKVLAVVMLGTLFFAGLFSRHVAVFFNRLLLSSKHYPTELTIQTVLINGTEVFNWNPNDIRPATVRSPQGRIVRFIVYATGKLPSEGAIQCTSETNSGSRTLELRRASDEELARLVDEPPSAVKVSDTAANSERRSTSAMKHLLNHSIDTGNRAAIYIAELPQLVEPFHYMIRLGDAWTDPSKIEMIALPVVQVDVSVVPPAYAGATTPQPASSRHVAVLEGSNVQLRVKSANKPLKEVTIRISQGDKQSTHSLQPVDTNKLQWELKAADTPLTNVAGEVRYEIQVRDRDGLSLEVPLHGYIQLKVDRLPTAITQIVHRVILPTATPVLEYRLNDDYGIASARLRAEIERQNDATESDESTPIAKTELPLQLEPAPLLPANLPHRGKLPIDLAPFKLSKGDRIKLTLEVGDYRGARDGRKFESEPILLEVSDEAGVLAAITEADERSEKRLSDLIQQQLGVGASQ